MTFNENKSEFTAIILAAGEGTRIKKYTEKLPKGMLLFAGKTIIERQIDIYRRAGAAEIIVIKGFAEETIDYSDVTYFLNEEFGTTNMLVSLFCAEDSLKGTVIVSYADIVFEPALLEKIMESSADVDVAVDTEWERYWLKRYGRVDFDIESLTLKDGLITGLGREDTPASDIDARYVGLLKFSGAGCIALKRIWKRDKDEFWDKPWQVSGKSTKKAYMTDMLQALIDDGVKVSALKIKGGWLEFDTNDDYERAIVWHKDGSIKELIELD